ncbi:MAG: hypothetical protein WC389_01275 [Lutibacter sp.]|jgi:hypothetical protein
MNNLELRSTEEVRTKVIYKELTLCLGICSKETYAKDELYRITENGKIKYDIGYRAASKVERIHYSIINTNVSDVDQTDFYISSNLRTYDIKVLQQGDKQKYVHYKILAGHKDKTYLPLCTLEAIVKEQGDEISNTIPVIVGYNITYKGDEITEQMLMNDDGTIHAFTKIQYNNLKNL